MDMATGILPITADTTAQLAIPTITIAAIQIMGIPTLVTATRSQPIQIPAMYQRRRNQTTIHNQRSSRSILRRNRECPIRRRARIR